MKAKKNIYIVDDVHENIQVLANILKNNGYNFSVARNGEQALEGIQLKLPDLILLDVSMPGMDGYEVCKELKSKEKTAEIPVIFITARIETEDIVKGFRAGGVDYLTKPFNSEELLARIKTHLDLKDSKEMLLELNATKDKFFRIISHDLRSPIASLTSFTASLIDNMDTYSPEYLKEMLKVIHDSTTATYKLVENLFAWASAQSGKIEFNPELIDVKELVFESVSMVLYAAVNKQIELTQHCEDHCVIFADRNMMQTVLRNLCSNAIKFTPKGGKITVHCKANHENVEFTVSDNGLGIPEKKIVKLFKVGETYSTRGTENESGSGLGLILCKEFVEKNGGNIWVQSKPGEGSQFIFTIPQNQ